MIKRNNHEGMLIKLDIKKSYDIVLWYFLD